MVNNERDEYASNLVAYAVKAIQSSKGEQKSLDAARQIIGLALHLSPRNKKCFSRQRPVKTRNDSKEGHCRLRL